MSKNILSKKEIKIDGVHVPVLISYSEKRKKSITCSVKSGKNIPELSECPDNFPSGFLYIYVMAPMKSTESELISMLSTEKFYSFIEKQCKKMSKVLQTKSESDENIFTDGSFLLFNGDRCRLTVSRMPLSGRRKKPYAVIEKNGNVINAVVFGTDSNEIDSNETASNKTVSNHDNEIDLIREAYRNFLKERGEIFFQARAAYYYRFYENAGLINTPPKSVSAASYKRKWGCCYGDNRICLNYFLAELPTELIDYVIIHELCHIRFKNHSRDFWALVSITCPDCKNKRKKVNEYAKRIEFRKSYSETSF